MGILDRRTSLDSQVGCCLRSLRPNLPRKAAKDGIPSTRCCGERFPRIGGFLNDTFKIHLLYKEILRISSQRCCFVWPKCTCSGTLQFGLGLARNMARFFWHPPWHLPWNPIPVADPSSVPVSAFGAERSGAEAEAAGSEGSWEAAWSRGIVNLSEGLWRRFSSRKGLQCAFMESP